MMRSVSSAGWDLSSFKAAEKAVYTLRFAINYLLSFFFL